MRWAVTLIAVAACHGKPVVAPAPAPAPDAAPAPPLSTHDTGCATDDDCMVTNFAGCCACPQCSVGQPHAISKAAEAKAEDVCTVVECDMGPCNLGGMCPPGEDASHFAARCVDHACSMDHR
jgi:hypothetical protein